MTGAKMLIHSMRKARTIPQVGLIKYNTIRGKNPHSLICIFEGLEDLPYYQTIIQRVRPEMVFSPLIANGKDQVLGLRDLLNRSSNRDQKIRFFIDKDFDFLKGHSPGLDLYCTEGYSIENHLVSINALRNILLSEYKCCADEDYKAVEDIQKLFTDALTMFFTEMHHANSAIHLARTTGVPLKNIEDRVTEYLVIELGEVTASGKNHNNLIGWPVTENQNLTLTANLFSQLDPLMEWRGKFIFGFFIKFLNLIKADRTSNTPKYFSKKSGIKFDPNGETVRSLASMSLIPSSLNTFISACPN